LKRSNTFGVLSGSTALRRLTKVSGSPPSFCGALDNLGGLLLPLEAGAKRRR
jgi:hypothetical protein